MRSGSSRRPCLPGRSPISSKVLYEVLTHPRAYTAEGVAASPHVSGRDFAKPVILKTADARLVMAVIPGPKHVYLKALEGLLGARVELAREADFVHVFPGCELGAEPPFGNGYNLPVYVDESLRKDPEIVFSAGTHTEAIRMRYTDSKGWCVPWSPPLLGELSPACEGLFGNVKIPGGVP